LQHLKFAPDGTGSVVFKSVAVARRVIMMIFPLCNFCADRRFDRGRVNLRCVGLPNSQSDNDLHPFPGERT
jgi:hypothetical protein